MNKVDKFFDSSVIKNVKDIETGKAIKAFYTGFPQGVKDKNDYYQIHLMLEGEDISYESFELTWKVIMNTDIVELKAFHDCWASMYYFSDVLYELACLDVKIKEIGYNTGKVNKITPDKVIKILEKLGYVNITEYLHLSVNNKKERAEFWNGIKTNLRKDKIKKIKNVIK